MIPGDEIEVHNGTSCKTVKVMQVTRGRAIVDWPLVGEYHVDLVTGELFAPPGFARGVFAVCARTGRLEGTKVSVVFDALLRLDSCEVGATLGLDNGQRGQVVDVLDSEGSVKIFVSGAGSGVWRMGSLRTGYRVSSAALHGLRASAGCVAVAS